MCLTTKAITSGYRLCQSFLGTKATSDVASTDLVGTMRRTAGVLFATVDKQYPFWSATTGTHQVGISGPASQITLEPVSVDRTRLREMFVSGVSELDPVFRSILTPGTLAELQTVAHAEDGETRYSSELWAKTLYEFAASYHKSVINRDHIVQALVPLYRGRTLTFIAENDTASAEQIECSIESLCGSFERQKPYLLEVWNTGK
jgi:hypothetical protein